MSPVWNHPSCSASAEAVALLRYPVKTLTPWMRISPSSAIRIPTPGSGVPTVPILTFSGTLTVAGAVVSVRPYPSRTITPMPR